MDPLTVMALVQGGQAVGGWAANKLFNKKPKFDDTTYGKRLKQLATEGIYSPQARGNILNKASRVAGQSTNMIGANYRGRLAKMGMLDSVAGIRGAADIETQGRQSVIDKATDIETANEMSKQQYATEYAQAKSGYQDRLREMKQQNDMNLVGGLLGAAGSFVAGKASQDAYSKLDLNDPASVTQFIGASGNPEEAINSVYKLAMSNYYGGRGNNPKAGIDTAIEKFRETGDRAALFASLVALGLDEKQMMMIANSL